MGIKILALSVITCTAEGISKPLPISTWEAEARRVKKGAHSSNTLGESVSM